MKKRTQKRTSRRGLSGRAPARRATPPRGTKRAIREEVFQSAPEPGGVGITGSNATEAIKQPLQPSTQLGPGDKIANIAPPVTSPRPESRDISPEELAAHKEPTTSGAIRVLVVDDDIATLVGLVQLARQLRFDTGGAQTVAEARSRITEWRPDVCLIDMMLPDGDGLDLIRSVQLSAPSAKSVVITGHGSIKTAVEAMKAGAFDYLLKPLKPVQIVGLLKAFEQSLPGSRVERPEYDGYVETGRFGGLVGTSSVMQEVFRQIPRIARTNSPVMITGESGTGKEEVAKAIHAYSRRRHNSFVAINCGAVSSTLIESELFGHEKGSFTGADKRRIGYFEMAHGGTLFLDEVTEMSMELQVKFLRVLEEKTFRRVGGNEELQVDVRIISSSNRDLMEAVDKEKLRSDLFYRLDVFPIRMPSLIERKEDIPALANHFLKGIEQSEGAGVEGLEPAALDVLAAHDWRGNVRELRNVIYRAYVQTDGKQFGGSTLRSVLSPRRAPALATGASAPDLRRPQQ